MIQEKSKQGEKNENNSGVKYTDLYLTGKREIFRII
jgi:hypothetical protein